jgi:hypothetical protein
MNIYTNIGTQKMFICECLSGRALEIEILIIGYHHLCNYVNDDGYLTVKV